MAEKPIGESVMKIFSFKMICLLLLVASCEKQCTGSGEIPAEKVVEIYLNIALNMEKVEQKNDLMHYTTGELKDALADASDETIIKAYIEKRYKINSFALVGRKDRTPAETEITYKLQYKELPEGSVDESLAVSVDTENTVVLVRENSRWLIREVVGNNTSFDFPVNSNSMVGAKDKDLDVQPATSNPAPTPASAVPAGPALVPAPMTTPSPAPTSPSPAPTQSPGK